jgi:DNA helicase-2/ATP-dependent DNA helicase PcrA
MRLTDEQRNAVGDAGNVCLVSRPGSGKTRVIVAKLLRCIDSVVDTTRRVACITHTNAAADEIDSRLRETCFGNEDKYYDVATIHGFALQNILRRFHQLLPELQNGYTILTPDAEAYPAKAKELLRAYGIKKIGPEEFERIQRAPNGTPFPLDTLPADLQTDWCKGLYGVAQPVRSSPVLPDDRQICCGEGVVPDQFRFRLRPAKQILLPLWRSGLNDEASILLLQTRDFENPQPKPTKSPEIQVS